MPSAGDVEQFAYCPHNWLLAQRGVDDHGGASRRGMERHHEIGAARRRLEDRRREEQHALTWMFRLLMAACSVTFLTIELVYLSAHPLHWLFLTVALVMTGASSALLIIAALARQQAEREMRMHGLVPGVLAAEGADGGAPLLEDSDLDLRGTPDYLLETDAGPVPVEVKTGRTPKRPHASHVLQLACYLHLLEARGSPPPYGLVQYPDGVFRVAWDDDLRGALRGVLDRLRAAERTGEANRDHDHAERCRGCARRSACDQALA